MTADDGLFSGVKKYVLHNNWGILTKVLKTVHEEDPKKSCQLVKNGHPMTPLKNHYAKKGSIDILFHKTIMFTITGYLNMI